MIVLYMILSKKSIVKNENVKKSFVEDDNTRTDNLYSYSEFEEFEIEKFEKKRRRSELLSASYSRIYDTGDGPLLPKAEKQWNESGYYSNRCSDYGKKAKRTAWCGYFLAFRHSIDEAGNVSKQGRLHTANFCKDRLCAMCNWRRSLKCFHTIKKALFAPISEDGSADDTLYNSFSWVFMTLTIKNVSGPFLRFAIQRMQKSFNLLMKYKGMQGVKGFYRTLEITVNPKDHTFHPHFHVLLAVDKSYFTSSDYITQENLLGMWQRAYGDYSITQVSLEAVNKDYKNKKKKVSIDDTEDFESGEEWSVSKTLAEISKYTLKDSNCIVTAHKAYKKKNKNGKYIYYPAVSEQEAIEQTDYNVRWLSYALEGIRLIGFGGIIKQVLKRIKADDVEDGDLVNVGDDEEIELLAEDYVKDAPMYLIRRYQWCVNQYALQFEYCVAADDLKKDVGAIFQVNPASLVSDVV